MRTFHTALFATRKKGFLLGVDLSLRPTPRQQQILVSDLKAPIRLDVYLSQTGLKLSRNQIQKLIDQDCIQVDEKPVRSSTKLKNGQKICVHFPTVERPPSFSEPIHLEIIYEDEDLAIVNKPSGLVVHASPGHPTGTLVDGLIQHFKTLSDLESIEAGEEMEWKESKMKDKTTSTTSVKSDMLKTTTTKASVRPGIVHRLDKGTSGLILIAKNNRCHLELAKQFQERKVEKTYLAIIYGTPRLCKGQFSNSLGRSRSNRKKISSKTQFGREALTFYEVLASGNGLSLIQLKPKTGRTHQLRVHLAESGNPIVGDPLYGGKNWLQKLPESLQAELKNFDHPALHAYKLCFCHPTTQKKLDFCVEPPEDFLRFKKWID